MEFGSLGLGSQSQSASNQLGASSLAATTTPEANTEQAVTPVDSGGAAQNDQQQDLLGRDTSGGNNRPSASPDDLQLTSRRTTLNFDSEQNRIFLEVVDTTTDEVIEQISSDQFVKFVDQALNPGGDSGTENEDEAGQSTELAV
ncbi:MAG: hypothetical protein GKS00_10565 [Alphaproteobacteria bacterium]|nr:hypothetical protein [Alphaproteobacteria bacterium]